MEVLKITGNLGTYCYSNRKSTDQNPVLIIFMHSFTKSGWQADSSNAGHPIHRMASGDPLSCTPENWDLKEKGFFP